jgi:hypothetical protein
MNINETFDKTKKEPVIMSMNLKVKEVKKDIYTLTGTVKADKCNVDILSDILVKIIKDCAPEEAREDILLETCKKLGFDYEDETVEPKPDIKIMKLDKEKAIHILRDLLEGV